MYMKTHEMLVKSLIIEINSLVRGVWTTDELVQGKQAIIPWEDLDIVKEVIPKFIEKGWIIKKKQALIESSGRKIILNIGKPPLEEYQNKF